MGKVQSSLIRYDYNVAQGNIAREFQTAADTQVVCQNLADKAVRFIPAKCGVVNPYISASDPGQDVGNLLIIWLRKLPDRHQGACRLHCVSWDCGSPCIQEYRATAQRAAVFLCVTGCGSIVRGSFPLDAAFRFDSGILKAFPAPVTVGCRLHPL